MAITTPLFKHHKFCDDAFADAEAACGKGDWELGAKTFGVLREQLEAHFSTEETLLFPAFESATGMTSGPTAVMRSEHRQMRDLLDQMRAAIDTQDGDGFDGAAETLLILMQQHNMKEENILYPMCDSALAGSEIGAAVAESLGSE